MVQHLASAEGAAHIVVDHTCQGRYATLRLALGEGPYTPRTFNQIPDEEGETGMTHIVLVFANHKEVVKLKSLS